MDTISFDPREIKAKKLIEFQRKSRPQQNQTYVNDRKHVKNPTQNIYQQNSKHSKDDNCKNNDKVQANDRVNNNDIFNGNDIVKGNGKVKNNDKYKQNNEFKNDENLSNDETSLHGSQIQKRDRLLMRETSKEQMQKDIQSQGNNLKDKSSKEKFINKQVYKSYDTRPQNQGTLKKQILEQTNVDSIGASKNIDKLNSDRKCQSPNKKETSNEWKQHHIANQTQILQLKSINKEIFNAYWKLSEMHFNRQLITRLGWQPWIQVWRQYRSKLAVATYHYQSKFIKSVIKVWQKVKYIRLLQTIGQEACMYVKLKQNLQVYRQRVVVCKIEKTYERYRKIRLFRVARVYKCWKDQIKDVQVGMKEIDRYRETKLRTYVILAWWKYVQKLDDQQFKIEVELIGKAISFCSRYCKNKSFKNWIQSVQIQKQTRKRQDQKEMIWNKIKYLKDLNQPAQQEQLISDDMDLDI